MTDLASAEGTRRARWWLRVLVVLGVVAITAVAAMLLWALTPMGPTDAALAALESGGGVIVTQTDAGWIFAPASQRRALGSGLVFYPGARVDARSYAPFARDLAARGHVVAIARMPLSLAVLKPDAADEFLASTAPELAGVERWSVGGHSLGGAMAARYAAQHATELDGLVLLAAYADPQADLSDSGLGVADVVGSLDGVLDRDAWNAGKARLPQDTERTVIEGGNHAQFGDYGAQPGDNPATISAREQRMRAVRATSAVIGGRRAE